MKPWLIVGPILIAITVVGTVAYFAHESSIMNTPVLCRDPNNISSHVYNPTRLQTINSCLTVSGIVEVVRAEKDGDYHLWFHVDQQYANLPNSENNVVHEGDLVAEIICATTVSQQDAVLACENYTNQIPLPSEGQNITVTGPYVLDNDHGWNEIHPVYSLSL